MAKNAQLQVAFAKRYSVSKLSKGRSLKDERCRTELFSVTNLDSMKTEVQPETETDADESHRRNTINQNDHLSQRVRN